jgi:hypothetical protein
MGREGTSFTFGLDERNSFDLEGLPSCSNRVLEAPIYLLRFGEPLPEEAVALGRVLVIVPEPELLDRSVWIVRYPVDQHSRRPEGLSKLLPQQHDVCDG